MLALNCLCPSSQAPAVKDWGKSNALATYIHQISLLTRMRLTVLGLPTASVPFTHNGVQMELLVGDYARAARRHVAAHTLPETLSLLRAKVPKSSENWQLLQASLFAGGLRVCPTSGTPVVDVQSCSAELKEALWVGLVALAKAVNKKDATDFDAEMATLSKYVQQHAGASR